MLFLNPKSHALSNGALVTAVSLDKTIHGNRACIQPAFSAYVEISLQANQVHHSIEH
jgi:hypothetical protein